MAYFLTLLPQLRLFALSYMVLGIEAWALSIITELHPQLSTMYSEMITQLIKIDFCYSEQ